MSKLSRIRGIPVCHGGGDQEGVERQTRPIGDARPGAIGGTWTSSGLRDGAQPRHFQSHSKKRGKLMSQDDLRGGTRRAFLGTATAATALTLAASAGAEQTPITGAKPDPTQLAQLTTSAAAAVPPAPQPGDWTKPAAMAIPKEGYFKLEQGRYGPIYPKTPANYGFSILAKIKPGTEEKIRQHGHTIEKGVAENPSLLAVLKLHYLR